MIVMKKLDNVMITLEVMVTMAVKVFQDFYNIRKIRKKWI